MKSVHPYVYCNIICNNQDTETLMDEWIEKVMCVCVYVKRETLCDFTHWYNLKKQRNQNKQTNKQTNKKKTISISWTHRYREQIGGYQTQEVGKTGESGQNVKISSYKK